MADFVRHLIALIERSLFVLIERTLFALIEVSLIAGSGCFRFAFAAWDDFDWPRSV